MEALAECQLPAIEARKDIGGIGRHPDMATHDDAVRLRALTDLNHDYGLVAPAVTVNLHVATDMAEAQAVLDRLLDDHPAAIDVASAEL